MKVIFCVLFFSYSLFSNGQVVNDTIIIFEHWRVRQWLGKKLSEDALQITLKQDSFLVDAAKTGVPMNLENRIRYVTTKKASAGINFYYTARFSGIRIIIPKKDTTSIRIKSIKTSPPHEWNNTDFDTVLQVSLLPTTHHMLWNAFYVDNDIIACDGLPCKFTDTYQLHSVNLPQMAAIRKSRKAKKKIQRIEKTLLYEVNLVTGIITNYKTGEQRKVNNTE